MPRSRSPSLIGASNLLQTLSTGEGRRVASGFEAEVDEWRVFSVGRRRRILQRKREEVGRLEPFDPQLTTIRGSSL